VADHEVTTGEVYRLLLSVKDDLRSLGATVVHRPEYDADKRALDRRFEQSAEVHVDLRQEIAEISARIEASEREQRQNRSKWTLAIVMAIVSPVFAIVASVLIRGGA
jgi:hypothetical protein